jgi:hypothetical protein
MSLHVRDGGVWKEVTADKGIHVRDAGVWKEVTEGYVRDAGTWKQFFVRSDPKTVNFYPIWTGSFGESHYENPQYTMLPIPEGLYQGDWDNFGHPSGMQRTVGVMRFDHAAVASALGGRNVISDCKLRLTCYAQYTSNGIYPVINSTTYALTNTRTYDLGSSLPAMANQTIGGARLNPNETDTVDLPNAVGQGFYDGTIKGLMLYHSGTDNPSKEFYRGAFYDTTATTSKRPYLTITADYI